ncbi:hypothetical protein SAMN06295879_0990 [Agreia bicolorata]|uniref:Uncharacterized protein n=1 Tax=Agreia bicolorata TaxID=110935 RepID=A0A1T4XCJ4_9MICO|nr:hypothetical protein [Agreia bicolorata]KJC65566.1 hypothetical protein TZ00_01695 [Agreia bicolorata]SKA86858.1 hypothetical protein SAMN06295879_0990 [Agreia bicolorata]
MTTASAPATTSAPVTYLTKAVGGGLFVLFWAIAIVLWVLVGQFDDAGIRGFVADAGIVFASLGTAAPFLATTRSLKIALGWGAVALGLFALADLGQVTVIVYLLRMFVPLVALLAPVNKFLNGYRVFV